MKQGPEGIRDLGNKTPRRSISGAQGRSHGMQGLGPPETEIFLFKYNHIFYISGSPITK